MRTHDFRQLQTKFSSKKLFRAPTILGIVPQTSAGALSSAAQDSKPINPKPSSDEGNQVIKIKGKNVPQRNDGTEKTPKKRRITSSPTSLQGAHEVNATSLQGAQEVNRLPMREEGSHNDKETIKKPSRPRTSFELYWQGHASPPPAVPICALAALRRSLSLTAQL